MLLSRIPYCRPIREDDPDKIAVQIDASADESASELRKEP